MLQSYMTIAIRRLLRNRVTSLINIGGLAVGFAAVTLIGLYVMYELSYNRWLPNIDQLYKVEFTETEPGHAPIKSAMTPAPLAAAMLKDYAGIEAATRLKTKIFTVRQGNRQFREEVYFADPSLFDLFDLKVVSGSRDAVLAGTDAVAISETLAQKYFGENNPIGEVLNIGGNADRRVAAVLKDMPENSHLNIQLLTRISTDPSGLLAYRDSWGSDQAHTYLKLKPGFDPSVIEQDARAFAERNITLTWTKLPPADLHHYTLMPLTDLYLYSDMTNHEGPVGDIATVMTFATVAVLVLALAVINFANLSTAYAMQCAREVAMRKVLGAHRSQVMAQFLGEAVMLTALALVVGLTMVELLLPAFSVFLGKNLSLAPLASGPVALGGSGLVLLVGVCGGMYPALVLSGFRPATILRANRSTDGGVPWLRNLLVVAQFSVSIALIAATIIIYRQTDYVRSADLGFDPNGKLIMPIWEGEVSATATALRDSFETLPDVRAVATTTAPLPEAPHGLGVFIPAGHSRDEAKSLTRMWVDAGFFGLMDMAPMAGRLFSPERRADYMSKPVSPAQPATRGAVVNLAAVHQLGFAEASQAVGEILTVPGEQTMAVTIVGVVPDAHFGSLHKAVEPTIFFVAEEPLYYLLVDVVGDTGAAVEQMAGVWNSLVPSTPMDATYLGDAYRALYQDAERQALVFAAFAAFAVFVACLGLYGLAAHTAQRRTKEMGVRKVLGARVMDIILLLTWQFTRLVIIAAPIGIMVSAFGAQDWLEGFAYRISLFDHAWVFAFAAAAAFVIAWATVGGQAANVARQNPIKALRYE